ncbi:MAG: outer membrane protein [Terriglobia bacterium]
MKKLIGTVVLLVMAPALMLAQDAGHLPRDLGYVFVGGATHQMGVTAGFGGEVYIIHGLGAGLEVGTAGFNTSTNGNPNWIGLGSADLSYHFFPKKIERRVVPFLTGGYTAFFGQDTCSGLGPCFATDKYGPNYTNAYNIGGGVDLFATKHAGLRFEVRYYGHGGRILWASFPNDAQLDFVAFRIGFTFR